jgi:SEC-C motif-containing protein
VKKLEQACPCGSGESYARCCGPLHAGAPATSAEALMRSRYSAFALNLPDYLMASWHPSTRPADLKEDGPAPRWIGLRVLAQSTEADTASVEFVATCRVGGRAQRLHEKSRFVFEEGRWYYVDGEY